MLSKKSFTENLGKKLRYIREQKGLSQEELAYEAGLYRTYVGHIENARYSPTAYVVYRLAKALKVPISELFNFEN